MKRTHIYAKYNDQRKGAKRRGIAWELDFDTWWDIWQQSGRWSERGNKRGQYVMSRPGDKGPYARDNIRIITTEQNSREIKYIYSAEASARAGRASIGHNRNLGRKHTDTARMKMRDAHRRRRAADSRLLQPPQPASSE